MSRHKEITKVVGSAPDGPAVGAFFDFDGTLIAGFSVFAFIKEQVLRAEMSPRELTELIAAMTSYGLGRLGFSGLMVAAAKMLRGVSEDSYAEFGEEVYREHLARQIYPESRALVEAHLEKGHTVAIISSATRYQIESAAADLGIDTIICTRLAVENGHFTGAVVRPTCWGQGKVAAARDLVKSRGVNLDESFFYTDSHEDLALLELVGRPQPLNPNDKLTAIAERRGWPVRRFASRGQPRVSDYLRSLAATWSIVPAFAAALPIWALTGSIRESQNFASSVFGDFAAALVGLRLNIKGEHHVWEKRPAVFIFNHQSKADVIIMAKLLRRDIAGVGKKEIRQYPLIGQILEFAGVVFIDRQHSASAIEAMTPLVDSMRYDGKSVVIAPEGTRAVSPRLGRFKKGAFHLAMQAGVPVVPVVIHNAIDVAPKGDFVFRSATVDIEVLPPVDTSEWRAKTIDRHVADVRNQFLHVLHQREEPWPEQDRTRESADPNSTTEVDADAVTEERDNVVLGGWERAGPE
jgi:putative phosphoserine phosphatase/1-acylglycerol-3-phosphate O-acyltransferase